MEMNVQLHVAAVLRWERATGTHWIGGWVGSRVGLDAVEKRKFETCPSSPQPVAIQTELSRLFHCVNYE
jgi:hypothetical protein